MPSHDDAATPESVLDALAAELLRGESVLTSAEQELLAEIVRNVADTAPEAERTAAVESLNQAIARVVGERVVKALGDRITSQVAGAPSAHPAPTPPSPHPPPVEPSPPPDHPAPPPPPEPPAPPLPTPPTPPPPSPPILPPPPPPPPVEPAPPPPAPDPSPPPWQPPPHLPPMPPIFPPPPPPFGGLDDDPLVDPAEIPEGDLSTRGQFAWTDAVLEADEAEAALQFAVSNEPHFATEAFTTDDLPSSISERVRGALPEALERLGWEDAAVASVEMRLAALNDGDSLILAPADRTDDEATKAAEWVLFLHREPKAFSGGELVVTPTPPADDQDRQIKPRRFVPIHNALVVVPSGTALEIQTVRCGSRNFHDGLFVAYGRTLSGDAPTRSA